MLNNLRLLYGLVFTTVLSLVVFACTEGAAPKSSRGGSTGGNKNTTNGQSPTGQNQYGSGQSFNNGGTSGGWSADWSSTSQGGQVHFCSAIGGNPQLVGDAQISPLLGAICGSEQNLNNLRSITYSGSGTPDIRDSTSSPENELKTFSCLKVGASPKQYFEMLKLQAFDANFCSTYTCTDQGTADIKAQTENSMTYRYNNTSSTEAVVTYTAKVDFFPVTEGSVYVVTTRNVTGESYETVKEFQGVVVIAGGTSGTEVFSVSKQIYDLGGAGDAERYKAIKIKAIEAFEKEAQTAFQNAQKAQNSL